MRPRTFLQNDRDHSLLEVDVLPVQGRRMAKRKPVNASIATNAKC
jgi:hypothetical protein